LVLMSACGGEEEGPAGAAATDDTSDPSTAAPYVQPGPWDEMNEGQRFEFMREVVVPEMRALFSKVDPAYAELSCGTCHGENASEVGFSMPNGVAPLDVSEFPLTESDDPKIAGAAKFMAEEVVPAMAELLGREPRSADNPMGFGCFGCHARAGE
jgi:hypothetical protein